MGNEIHLSDEQLLEALKRCEDEPIEKLGYIQSHGYLFVLDSDFIIVYISD